MALNRHVSGRGWYPDGRYNSTLLMIIQHWFSQKRIWYTPMNDREYESKEIHGRI